MSRMHECSQVVHSTDEVLLRQMPNHRSSINTGVMWSCLLVRVISLAALFWTRLAELSMLTGCYATVSGSSRVERWRVHWLHFSRLLLLGSAVLMTVYTDGSYMRRTQQSHDLSSSDVDPCALPDSLCGVTVKPYHRNLSRSNIRTPSDDVLI